MKLLASLVTAACAVLAADAQNEDPLAAIRTQLTDPDSVFTLIVEFQLKPGTDKAFFDAAQDAVRQTRREPGNDAYEVHRDAKVPERFIFFEKWRGLRALEAHVAQDYTRALLARAAEISAIPMTLRVLTPFIPPGGRAGPRNPALK